MPWVSEATEPLALIEAMRERLNAFHEHGWPEGRAEPHGRHAWSISLGGGAYIDVSVMPRKSPSEPA